jgi:2-oxo-4-hydroxy-4-carboxy--5-ureidoimidazoline (OHCU) decarboxylase
MKSRNFSISTRNTGSETDFPYHLCATELEENDSCGIRPALEESARAEFQTALDQVSKIARLRLADRVTE